MPAKHILHLIAALLLCSVAGELLVQKAPPPAGTRPDRVRWVLPCSTELAANPKPRSF